MPSTQLEFKIKRSSLEHRNKAILSLIFMLTNLEMPERFLNILYECMLISKGNVKYYTFSRPARKILYKTAKEKYNYDLSTKSMFPILKKFKELKLVTTDEEGISYFTDRFQRLINILLTNNKTQEINIKYIIDDIAINNGSTEVQPEKTANQ